MWRYILELDKCNWGTTEIELLNFVSDERKNKVLRYQYQMDKLTGLYAELLTKMFICKLFNKNLNDVIIKIDTYGRPYLENMGEVDFNFSHSGNVVLCCISHENVGADVEFIAGTKLEVMKKIFHPREINYVLSENHYYTRIIRFYEIWTRKEAYAKWKKIGLTTRLREINTLQEVCCFNTVINNKRYIYSSYSKTDKQYFDSMVYKKEINDFYLAS